MDFFYKNTTLSIDSEKKLIEFFSDGVSLDGLKLEIPGEYEKSGFLAYTLLENDMLITHVTIEGYHVGFIPEGKSDITSESLDFLGDLDILIAPTSKAALPLLEKIEPRMLITYGESAHELALHMGISEPPVPKYRLRESDLSLDKMNLVVMGD